MPKFEIIIGILALVLVGGVLLWAFWDQLPSLPIRTSKNAESIETKQGSDGLVKKQAASLEDITQEFIKNYSQAINKKDTAAAEEAKNFLSDHGRHVVEEDVATLDGLKRLTGNLSAPQKIEVKQNRKQSDNFAEVTVLWIYPDKNLERYFYFTLENKEWKIDSIQEIKQ